jgi:hypothetical protein
MAWTDRRTFFSLSFLFFSIFHFILLFLLFILLYCYYGGLGWVSIIALPVWRWVRGCFLAFSLGFSREENGMGNRKGEGE